PGHLRFVENAAPPRGHLLGPCASRGAAAIPVQRLISENRPRGSRVLRLRADAQDERFDLRHHLASELLVRGRLLREDSDVNRVERLNIEPLLTVDVEEFLNLGRSPRLPRLLELPRVQGLAAAYSATPHVCPEHEGDCPCNEDQWLGAHRHGLWNAR